MEPCAAAADDGGSVIGHRRPPCTTCSDSPTSTSGRAARALRRQAGQGTVEYVALILLIALIMAGVIAAMKGFRTAEGKELGDVILGKLKEVVRKVEF